MNRRKRTELENNIVASLQAYRLQKEVEIVEAEANGIIAPEGKDALEEVAPSKKKGFLSFLKSALTSAKSEIAQGKGQRDLDGVKENYANYVSSLPEGVSIEMSKDEEAFANLINVYFDNDEGSAKISMALELLALENDPNGPKYYRKDKSRKALSEFFLGDENLLDDINRFFAEASIEIGMPKISAFSRGFLYGLAAGSVAMLGPRFLIRLFRIKTDAASPRWLLKENAKALAASELLMLSTLVGGGYLSKRKYKRKSGGKLRDIIRDSLDSEIAYSFATAITIWQFNHEEESEDSKENLDLIIKMVDDVRADAQYLAIVEQADQEKNLKKILVCNNAITFLLKIRR